MDVVLTKISDEVHAVTITRRDGTTERVELNTRSFLRHDLAHFTVELELGLTGGVWGSVARGGSLSGDGLDGSDMNLAESLAGPVQTLMRTEADVATIRAVLAQAAPDVLANDATANDPTANGPTSGGPASDNRGADDLAERIHERLRQLRGHWKATPYGADMHLTWPEPA